MITLTVMVQQIAVEPSGMAPEHCDRGIHVVDQDLGYQRLAIVNVVYVGHPGAGDRGWALVDTGIRGSAPFIRSAAESRFGQHARPAAIVLTHGHFDHVGAVAQLAEEWDAPIYAHTDEFPFLTGVQSYPEPDTTVGGMMSLIAQLYPRRPIDVSTRLRALPDDGSVPGLANWRWVPTPGHSPGQIALWRERDRALISGDAVITTAQESAYSVALQRAEIHGPPRYLTPEWNAAEHSVRRLAELAPNLIIPGHGRAMHGSAMHRALVTLAERFPAIAVPENGRYV